ncbi:MAG: hypothetical protein ACREUK_10455, partial [Burkholderiales bacterium]
MDESEIRYLEAHLETEPKLPLSERQLAALIGRAKRERAEAVAGMLSRLGAGIAAYFRALRESA